MSTTPELPTQYLGNVVPYSFNAGFICLSYVISLIGAMSTLELVSRRTSQKGLYNQCAHSPMAPLHLKRKTINFVNQCPGTW